MGLQVADGGRDLGSPLSPCWRGWELGSHVFCLSAAEQSLSECSLFLACAFPVFCLDAAGFYWSYFSFACALWCVELPTSSAQSLRIYLTSENPGDSMLCDSLGPGFKKSKVAGPPTPLHFQNHLLFVLNMMSRIFKLSLARRRGKKVPVPHLP